MAKTRKASKSAPPGPFRESWEEFGRPYIPSRGRTEPSCFNGMIHIRRYRVTIEEIEEPTEVLAERLRRLWRSCDNPHHRHPLREAAANLGIELAPEECGIDRPNRD